MDRPGTPWLLRHQAQVALRLPTPSCLFPGPVNPAHPVSISNPLIPHMQIAPLFCRSFPPVAAQWKHGRCLRTRRPARPHAH